MKTLIFNSEISYLYSLEIHKQNKTLVQDLDYINGTFQIKVLKEGK